MCNTDLCRVSMRQSHFICHLDEIEEEQISVAASETLLEERGPNLGFPHSSAINGSEHSHCVSCAPSTRAAHFGPCMSSICRLPNCCLRAGPEVRNTSRAGSWVVKPSTFASVAPRLTTCSPLVDSRGPTGRTSDPPPHGWPSAKTP
jgi:hypothetical protein